MSESSSLRRLCPQCGSSVHAGDRFCYGCGATLEAVCASCGSALRPDARYCAACGTAIGTSPQTAMPAPRTAPRLARPVTSLHGLATTVTVLLAVWAVLGVAQIVTTLRLVGYDGSSFDSPGAFGVLRDLEPFTWFVTVTLIACVCALWYQGYGNVSWARPDVARYKTGWAIGSWFVPLLNFVRPREVLEDVSGAAVGTTELPRFVNVWWVLFWAGVLIGAAGNRLLDAAGITDGGASIDHVSTFHLGVITSIVGEVVLIAAAWAAIRVIRLLADWNDTITSSQQRVATVGV